MDFIWCSFNYVLLPSPSKSLPPPPPPIPLQYIFAHFEVAGVALSFNIELFCEHYRFFHWLIRSCTGSWVKISSPKKQSHSAVRHNPDPVHRATVKMANRSTITLPTMEFIRCFFSLKVKIQTKFRTNSNAKIIVHGKNTRIVIFTTNRAYSTVV